MTPVLRLGCPWTTGETDDTSHTSTASPFPSQSPHSSGPLHPRSIPGGRLPHPKWDPIPPVEPPTSGGPRRAAQPTPHQPGSGACAVVPSVWARHPPLTPAPCSHSLKEASNPNPKCSHPWPSREGKDHAGAGISTETREGGHRGPRTPALISRWAPWSWTGRTDPLDGVLGVGGRDAPRVPLHGSLHL